VNHVVIFEHAEKGASSITNLVWLYLNRPGPVGAWTGDIQITIGIYAGQMAEVDTAALVMPFLVDDRLNLRLHSL